MAEYEHVRVADGQGGQVVFPPFIDQDVLDALQRTIAIRPDDLFVVAYPKSGTTWMEQIVHLLANNGEQGDLVLSEAVPWLEGAAHRYGGLERFLSTLSPRRFHSHLPVHLMPGIADSQARYIYVSRDPRDVAVSYYFHARSKANYVGHWDEFFELFLAGEVGFGSVFEHVRDWQAAAQHNDRILCLTYEAMQSDLAGAVSQVAHFMGLDAGPDLIEKVTASSRFDAMAGNPKANLDWVPQRKGEPRHMRKGVVGDWRNYFSEGQRERVERLNGERGNGERGESG